MKSCKNPHCSNEVIGLVQKKFCSQRCVQHRYYLRNKEKICARVRKWERKNPEKKYLSNKKAFEKFRKNKPERFNELMNNSYYRNKDKCHSRIYTLKVLNLKKKDFYLEKLCRQCKSNKNLQFHHETYPITYNAIRQAIRESKIYYLCKSCHQKVTSQNR